MSENIKSFQFAYMDFNNQVKIETELNDYLKRIGKEALFTSLSYLINEITFNASKANLKRIHFYKKNLNIEDEEEYKKGIETFKQDYIDHQDNYFIFAQELGYYILVKLYLEKEDFVFAITNNSTLLPIEQERIDSKFKVAKNMKSMEEVFEQVNDSTEGAGLGFVTMILMIKNMGLDVDIFKIIPDHDKTEVRISIPIANREEEETIATEIVKIIDDIPQFPPHILELKKALENENAQFSDIAHIIEKDPALIAELLKTANSAIFALPHKVSSIEDAIKFIGFEGVKNVIIDHAIRRLLAKNFNKEHVQKIMNHSVEVTEVAIKIVKQLKLKKYVEDVYIGAMLHDIGKIIISSIDDKLMKNVEKLCFEKGINRFIIENLTKGYSHSLIGARLAEKWNFPAKLVDTIKYHHSPIHTDADCYDIISIVYLANTIYYYKRNKYDFSNINSQVLRHFNLLDPDKFEKLIQSIS